MELTNKNRKEEVEKARKEYAIYVLSKYVPLDRLYNIKEDMEEKEVFKREYQRIIMQEFGVKLEIEDIKEVIKKKEEERDGNISNGNI